MELKSGKLSKEHSSTPPEPRKQAILFEEAIEELGRILQSKAFSNSERLRKFLSYCVRQAVQGREEMLKESLIGIAVFDKDTSFDPRLDAIVRVQARRLRSRLKAYYAGEGRNDPLVIEFPKGAYRPVFRYREGMAASGESPKLSRVGVKPLVSLGKDGDAAQFASTLSLLLTEHLRRTSGCLVVAPGPDAAATAGEFELLKRLCRRQGAAVVLEGTCIKEDSSIRVYVRLVRCIDMLLIWGAAYDADMQSCLRIHECMARRIVHDVRVELARQLEVTRMTTAATKRESLHLYRKARHFWNKSGEESLRKAEELFLQAVEMDRQFLLPYLGLADCYLALCMQGYVSPEEVLPRWKEMILKATTLAPDCGEAQTTLGALYLLCDWDAVLAERHLRQGLKLSPSYMPGYHWLAIALALHGNAQQALRILETAKKKEPNLSATEYTAGRILAALGYYRHAIERLQNALRLDPQHLPALCCLAWVQQMSGLAEQALETVRQAAQIEKDNPSVIAAQARTEAALGNRDPAVLQLQRLAHMSTEKYVSPFELAHGYVVLQESEQALTWLEKAYEKHDPNLLWLDYTPEFDLLSHEPRFQLLARSVRRPQEAGRNA